MHAMLREEFARKAKASEILLLFCSVIFCATTFADKELYAIFSLPPEAIRMTLGIASVATFALSLSFLILDWKGGAARHGEAMSNLTHALSKFRKYRGEEKKWPEEVHKELDSSYWEADRNSPPIPEERFVQLKARYLRKVRLSELKDSYPGCPSLILSSIVRIRDTMNAFRVLFFGRGEE